MNERWKSKLRDDDDFDLECRKIAKRALLRNDNDNDWESRRMYGICGKYIRKYLQNASGRQINKIFNSFRNSIFSLLIIIIII